MSTAMSRNGVPAWRHASLRLIGASRTGKRFIVGVRSQRPFIEDDDGFNVTCPATTEDRENKYLSFRWDAMLRNGSQEIGIGHRR